VSYRREVRLQIGDDAVDAGVEQLLVVPGPTRAPGRLGRELPHLPHRINAVALRQMDYRSGELHGSIGSQGSVPALDYY
jgi:hypothetical protein